jgi:hypothetical protein
MIEITVKIANTMNVSKLPSGKEFYFNVTEDIKIGELSEIFHEEISKVLIKSAGVKQKCWKYDLYTYQTEEMNLENSVKTYFTTNNVLNVIDRNETIFYAILASLQV